MPSGHPAGIADAGSEVTEAVARRPALWRLLSPCRLCPRECGADRMSGGTGACSIGLVPKVASWAIHRGEEPPVSGERGAGNVFFTGCNLRCRFCQNYPISQGGVGRETDIGSLARGFLRLQRRGARCLNLVTATHVAPQAAAAVDLARGAGLTLPVVWNSNGYETPRMVELLADVVDLWLPDMKSGDDRHARDCSGVGDYVAINRAAVTAMLRQKGPLPADDPDAPLRGVVIRHLVLPGGLSDTDEVLAWIAGALGRDVPVSLMCQYFPAHRVVGEAVLGRRLTDAEWAEARAALERHGITAGWVQDFRTAGDDCPCHRFLEGCPADGRCRSIA